MGVIINQLHQLSEVGESEESGDNKLKEKQMPCVSDFDVETVCSFLTQSNEVRYNACMNYIVCMYAHRENFKHLHDFKMKLHIQKLHMFKKVL